MKKNWIYWSTREDLDTHTLAYMAWYTQRERTTTTKSRNKTQEKKKVVKECDQTS